MYNNVYSNSAHIFIFSFKMAAGVTVQCSRSKLNEYEQEVYGSHKCSRCTELENNLQVALSELSSSQLIIKLLYKELKETAAKYEVMSNATTGKVNWDGCKSRNRWSTAEYKRHSNIGNNSKLKSTYSSHVPITTTNRYVALSNQSDCPPGSEDVTLEEEVSRPPINVNKKIVMAQHCAK
jgi:hypothetical protein